MKVKNIEPIEVLKNDPQAMQSLFDHIANGGSAIDIAKLWGLSYIKLMRHIKSKQDLQEKYDEALELRNEWARERVISEVKNLSTFNIRDMFNSDGTLKKAVELPENLLAAIKEVDKDGALKFQDKLKALDLFGKQLGLFVDKKEINGTMNMSLESIVMAGLSIPRDKIPTDDKE